MGKKLATRAEAVERLGLPSARALDRLIERGAPGPAPGKKGSGRYDVAAIQAWMTARQARVKPTLDLAAERAKLARVQRQLTTLKLREHRGDVVRAKDALLAYQAIAGAVRVQLLAVPRNAVLGGLPREHEALVKRLIVQALRDLSDIRTMAQLGAITAIEEDTAA